VHLPENKVKLKTYAEVGDMRQAGLLEEVGGFYKVGFAERRGAYPTIRSFRSRTDEKEWIANEVERLVKKERVRPEDILILFNYAKVFDDLPKIIRSRIVGSGLSLLRTLYSHTEAAKTETPTFFARTV